MRASDASTSAGSDADAPAAQESFVLRRLQARLQELEAENDELRAGAAALEAQCETNDELLGTLQASLDETSAEAEEAEARVRALERQLEESSTKGGSPVGSPISDFSRRSRQGTPRSEAPAAGLSLSLYAVLAPVVVYHLVVTYQGWSHLSAVPLHAPVRPLPLIRVLWTVAVLASLLYSWAIGSRTAVRATCVAPMVYHGAAGSAALYKGVDTDGLVPQLAATVAAAGRLQLALAALLLLACWLASDPGPRKRKAD